MTKRMLSILGLALAAGALLAAALVAGPAIAGDGEKKMKKVVVKSSEETGGDHHGMSWQDHFPDADHVKIEDLGDLAVGQARTYVTEDGKRVDITRETEEVYLLEVGGKEVRFGGESYGDDDEGGEEINVEKKVTIDETDSEEGERHVEKRVIKRIEGDGEPEGEPVVVEIVDETEEDGHHRVEKRVIVVHVDD